MKLVPMVSCFNNFTWLRALTFIVLVGCTAQIDKDQESEIKMIWQKFHVNLLEANYIEAEKLLSEKAFLGIGRQKKEDVVEQRFRVFADRSFSIDNVSSIKILNGKFALLKIKADNAGATITFRFVLEDDGWKILQFEDWDIHGEF